MPNPLALAARDRAIGDAASATLCSNADCHYTAEAMGSRNHSGASAAVITALAPASEPRANHRDT